MTGVLQRTPVATREDRCVVTDRQRERAAELLTDLRALVLDLPPGGRLPTERVLAERWGVARMTVRRAIASLAREGLLRSVQGSGTTRTPGPLQLSVGLRSFADSVAAAGLQPATRLLGFDARAVPPPPAAAFLRLERAPATRLQRLRFGDDVPLALEEAWLPSDLVPDLTEERAAGSVYHYLAERSLLPDSGEESIRAGFPEPDEARLLDMPTGSPVLRLVRRALSGGRPVEYATAVFPASRYEISFPLNSDRVAAQ